MDDERQVSFTLGGMCFEYDEQKNQTNIRKHGISFKSAARVFLTTTASSCLMKSTVKRKIGTIR